MKPYDDLLEDIAQEFSKLLRAELGDEVVGDINNKNELVNVQTSSTDEKYCHSHDHCDTNMLMLSAFRTVMKRNPFFLVGSVWCADNVDKELHDQDMKMFNEAWAMASNNGFEAGDGIAMITKYPPCKHCASTMDHTDSLMSMEYDDSLVLAGQIMPNIIPDGGTNEQRVANHRRIMRFWNAGHGLPTDEVRDVIADYKRNKEKEGGQ